MIGLIEYVDEDGEYQGRTLTMNEFKEHLRMMGRKMSKRRLRRKLAKLYKEVN